MPKKSCAGVNGSSRLMRSAMAVAFTKKKMPAARLSSDRAIS